MKPVGALFLLLTLPLLVSIAQAAPPFIDFQWKVSSENCLDSAKSALKAAGFKSSSSTNPDSAVVGSNGEYKGIVACVGEYADMAVFIVAGPDYQQAKKYALTMKRNF